MPLCFAYGSNMDRAAMASRCPASRPIGVARLAGHRPAIMHEGYLTVARDPRRTVHGLLWDVALADMPALDRYEAVASGLYVKEQRQVRTEAGSRTALVYLGRNAGPGLSRTGYMESVVAAARDAGLPAGYVAELEALRPGAGSAAPAAPKPLVSPRYATPFDRERDRPPGGRWTP